MTLLNKSINITKNQDKISLCKITLPQSIPHSVHSTVLNGELAFLQMVVRTGGLPSDYDRQRTSFILESYCICTWSLEVVQETLYIPLGLEH